jgi:hypothetical protein
VEHALRPIGVGIIAILSVIGAVVAMIVGVILLALVALIASRIPSIIMIEAFTVVVLLAHVGPPLWHRPRRNCLGLLTMLQV